MHEIALKFQQTPYDQIVRAGISLLIQSQGTLDDQKHLEWIQEITPELVDKVMAERGDFSRSFYQRIHQRLLEEEDGDKELATGKFNPDLLKRTFATQLDIGASGYDWLWMRTEDLEDTRPLMNMAHYRGPMKAHKVPIGNLEDIPYSSMFDLQLSIDEQTTRDQIALPLTRPVETVYDEFDKCLAYGTHMLLSTPTTLGQLYRRDANSTVPVVFLIWRDGTLYAVVPVTGLESNVMIGNITATGTDFYRTDVPVETNPKDTHQYVAVPVSDSTRFWCRPDDGMELLRLTFTGSHPHVPGLVDQLSEEHVRLIKFARMNKWYHIRNSPTSK